MNIKEMPRHPEFNHPMREGRLWGEFKRNLGAKPSRRRNAGKLLRLLSLRLCHE